MDKAEIREYFNKLAPGWDDKDRRNDEIIGRILENAQFSSGLRVLDVACGTGVMFPYYLKRDAKEIWGIDISEEMIKIAKKKFAQPEIHLQAVDAESFSDDCGFDRIMIYNAFPHFTEPEMLTAHLSGLLNKGGILTVAHSMSRKQLDLHHSGSARDVSRRLMPAAELGELMGKYLKPCCIIDDERMYQVSAVKE